MYANCHKKNLVYGIAKNMNDVTNKEINMMRTFEEKTKPDYIIVLIYVLFWIGIVFEYLMKG